MNRAEIAARFNNLYFGDSLLEEVVLSTATATCRFRFNTAKVLKGKGASIFDPEASFAPALLRLEGVKSILCEGGTYQLNSTVVDFGAVLIDGGDHVEFYFDLTGGTEPESFMVRIKVLAREFLFGGVDV